MNRYGYHNRHQCTASCYAVVRHYRGRHRRL